LEAVALPNSGGFVVVIGVILLNEGTLEDVEEEEGEEEEG